MIMSTLISSRNRWPHTEQIKGVERAAVCPETDSHEGKGGAWRYNNQTDEGDDDGSVALVTFRSDGAATRRCALTSVETAEVYIGVCPVDINTGCKTTEGRGVTVGVMQIEYGGRRSELSFSYWRGGVLVSHTSSQLSQTKTSFEKKKQKKPHKIKNEDWKWQILVSQMNNRLVICALNMTATDNCNFVI